MMILPAGRGPAPDYRWVGPDAAARVRARSAVTGTVMLLWSLVAGITTLLAGARLPAADDPINDIGVLAAAASALLLLGVAVGVLGARQYVVGEYVDVAGGRVLGRVVLALALVALGCGALAAAVLFLMARAAAGLSPDGGVGVAAGSYPLLPISCGVLAVIGGVLNRRRLRPRAPLTEPNGVAVTTPAGRPPPPPGQVWVPEPVADRVRGALLGAGLGIVGAGALLVVVTVVMALSVPGANGFPDAMTMGGGTIGAYLIVMAAIVLLNGRHALSGQAFLPGHARRIRQSLVVLWLLSVVMTAVIAYGATALPGAPVLARLLLPIGSCVLTGIAVLVARSVLTPASPARS